MADDPALAPDRLWEQGWKGHESAQRARLARLSLALKLEWLEETQRLLGRMRAAQRPPLQSRPDERPDS
jgi:hypothetical protein